MPVQRSIKRLGGFQGTRRSVDGKRGDRGSRDKKGDFGDSLSRGSNLPVPEGRTHSPERLA